MTTRRLFLQRCRVAAALGAAGWMESLHRGRAADKEVLPKHVTPATIKAVVKGARLSRRPAIRGWLMDHFGGVRCTR